MDPYLEGELWTTFHTQLAAEVARQLAPRLRPRYLALTEKTFYLEAPNGVAVAMEPDVSVAESHTTLAATGVGIAPAPVKLATIMPRPVPHIRVDIRDVAQRRLVTAIEFLSPTNKRDPGRGQYLAKRRRMLLSSAHLLEIDLLRRGRRVPMREPLPPGSYFVLLSRAGQRPLTEVWPIALNQPLPTVPVPLREGDADVPLELQAALTNVYDLCGLDLAIDYTQPPEVRFRPEAAAWADERLRAAGLRS
jgi:hypothetical protein